MLSPAHHKTNPPQSNIAANKNAVPKKLGVKNYGITKTHKANNLQSATFGQNNNDKLNTAQNLPYNFINLSVNVNKPLPIQPKLTINTPGDQYEQEADAMADKVMRMPDTQIQRKCATCEKEDDNQIQRKPLLTNITPNIQAKGFATATAVTPLLNNKISALQGGGKGMDIGTKNFMQGRFGADFSRVKIHADNNAADLSHQLNARAFTVGNDIYFNSGEYRPTSETGKHLLAHELTHTLQQTNKETLRKQGNDVPDDPLLLKKTRIAALKTIIETKFSQTLALKSGIKQQSSVEMDNLRQQLVQNRTELIGLLKERLDLISYLLSKKNACDDETTELEQEQLVTSQWLYPLTRWQKRMEIEDISTQIGELNAKLATYKQCDATTDALFAKLDQLQARKKSLARELTSTALEYKQFDPRWGKARYGNAAGCTTVAEAACGPTSLAMVLNFYELENPEGLAISGNMEIVLPSETSIYAKDHGRVCNQGTNGNTMMKDIDVRWENYRGKAILLGDVINELNNGRLVIFLCKNCSGKNGKGQTETYEGHFMVLNGVDDAGKIFNVLDSGRKEATNIETIDLNNLKTKTGGFWTVNKL